MNAVNRKIFRAINCIEENEEILGRGGMYRKMKVQKKGVVRNEESVKNNTLNITDCALLGSCGEGKAIINVLPLAP